MAVLFYRQLGTPRSRQWSFLLPSFFPTLWPGCSPEESSSPAASYLSLAVTLMAQGTEVSKEGVTGRLLYILG